MIKIMQFILFLSSLIVISYAQEYLNVTKVSWDKATKSCTVPKIGRLRSSNDARDENGFYAWTATHEWSSGWASFRGCIDINIPRVDKQRLSDHFRNINLSFIADRDDVFQCAFHCTNLNYFVYYMNLCLCITSIENYPVIDSTGCVTTCHDDSVFCSSGFGLPLFKYQTDLEFVRPTAYLFLYHCVYKKDGHNVDGNCYSSSHYFRCDGNDNIGHPMKWANAVNYCTNLNSKLSKTVGNVSLDVWSRYFRYQILSPDTNNERRKCVAVFINRNKRSNGDSIKWSHYQYKNCSELLQFICVGNIDTKTNITSVTNVHPTSNAIYSSTLQIPSKHKAKTENDLIAIVITGIPTLSLVVVVLFLIRKCLTEQVFQRASQNIRRNNINVHQIVQTYGNCDVEDGNKNRVVHDGYSDPWEIRHNIIQQGELHQQNTLIEETET